MNTSPGAISGQHTAHATQLAKRGFQHLDAANLNAEAVPHDPTDSGDGRTLDLHIGG